MTNEAIGTLAAFALVIALASGARAGWKTNADADVEPRRVPVKGGETWRLHAVVSRPFDDAAEQGFRTGIGGGGAEVLEVDRHDPLKPSFVVRYGRDNTIQIGVKHTLSVDGVSMTAELVNAEKLS